MTDRSRFLSLQMAHTSLSVMLLQMAQVRRSRFALTSALARSITSSSSIPNMKKARRWAVFGPIPGSRIKASISFSIGSGTYTFRPLPLQFPLFPLKQPRQIETARQFAQILGDHLVDLFHRLVESGGDQILQHFHIFRIHRLGGDLHS